MWTDQIDALERAVEHEANKGEAMKTYTGQTIAEWNLEALADRPARIHTRDTTREPTTAPWKVVEKHTGNHRTLYYLCRFPEGLPAQTYGVYSRREDADNECWLLNELGD